jgi:hypothetical protein
MIKARPSVSIIAWCLRPLPSGRLRAHRVIGEWTTFHNTKHPHSTLERGRPRTAYWHGRDEKLAAHDSARLLTGSAAEHDAWLRLPAPERSTRFFETWTLKEAYVKATGEGLTRPLTGFDLHTTECGIVVDLPAQSPTLAAKWNFAVYAPTERSRLSVAARFAGDLRFAARQWPPEGKPVELHPLFQSTVM